ncbi:sugar ABC transporter permease [Novosphingobium flavum]|uniref:Sugar ABC transporter permease n=1 Tax=Novosphingobium flavum TaxID=1778672 RepID=A0A7X1FR65_9SPHN|nr:sugar ABC transporter permease [Novosphingobium flavum]MBC2665433.1 sugar ABC transporter permease [Novosphingobium flavum]
MTVRASRHARRLGRLLVTPSVVALLAWMIVPLAMTLWFAALDYRLLDAGPARFAGLANFAALLADPGFYAAVITTLYLLALALALSVGGGLVLALLLDVAAFGRGALRVLVISPFFVMPTVAALVWKNLMMSPVSGVLAWIAQGLGLPAFDWFAHAPLVAVAIIVAWQWLPFAALIFLTALQSLDSEQREAAQLDGAGPIAMLRYLTLPHLARPAAVIVMIETLFLLSLFAEIFVTTGGGPGNATTNLAFLIYQQALQSYDVGGASAAGLVAVVLANIVAFFMVRLIGRSLTA